MQTVNLSKLLKNYSSGWIAISSDYKRVVATGGSLKKVSEEIEKLKKKDVVLISASKNYRGFVTTDVGI